MSPSGLALDNSSAGTDTAFERFCRIRADAGLRAALGYLGAFTGWRCVAVVRSASADAELRALAYFDRDRPELQGPEAWLDSVRAACLVQGRDGRVREAGVATDASGPGARDAQLLHDPERPGGICRCVPVIDRDGKLHASLCIFDDACGRAIEIDPALLLQVAASIAVDAASLIAAPPQPQAQPQPPDEGWQSAAGEEDPGSALEELPHPPNPPLPPPHGVEVLTGDSRRSDPPDGPVPHPMPPSMPQ
jgi:hypothetical protein